MIALFDTSVIVCLILQESGYDVVERKLSALSIEPRLSDFGRGEFTAAVGAKVRTRTIDTAAGARMLDELESWLGADAAVCVDSTDVEAATGFVRRFDTGLRMPDAIHLATARRMSCPIVSLDRVQLRAAATCGVVPLHPIDLENIGE